MKFNYSQTPQTPYPQPEYNKSYGEALPPVQAQGNLTYLQFIDLVGHFWSLSHPDIKYGPFGNQQIYNPELGYIIYSMDDKRPANNHPKPRLFEIRDAGDKKVVVYLENFNVFVKFTAIHKNPRMAEEIIEDFETFMMEMISVFKMLGLENLQYARRLSDSHETRYGDDVASRSIIYMAVVQKILTEELNKLEQVLIQAQAIINNDATPTYTGATPDHTVLINLMDNHMSGQ